MNWTEFVILFRFSLFGDDGGVRADSGEEDGCVEEGENQTWRLQTAAKHGRTFVGLWEVR